MSALQCTGVMCATMLMSMSGLLLFRGIIMWATMLGRSSALLSVTWWLRREESWPELMVDWAEWEIKLMFWKTSKDSALWVSNDPAEGLDGAMMARVEGGMERLVVDVL